MNKDGKDRSQVYFDEAREQLELLEQSLLLLEQKDEADLDLINQIFRGIHTIKGGADFLGLIKIKELSHAAEDVLDLVRHQKLVLTADGISTLLVVIDCLKEMLSDPETSQAVNISSLLEDIADLSRETETANTNISEPVHADENSSSVMQVSEDHLLLGTYSAPRLFSFSRQEAEAWWQYEFEIYILEFDSDDNASASSSRGDIMEHLKDIGYVLGSQSASASNSKNQDQQALYILLRSTLSKNLILKYLSLDTTQLHYVPNPDKVSETVSNSQQAKRVEQEHTPEKSTTSNQDSAPIIEPDQTTPAAETAGVVAVDRRPQTGTGNNQSIRVNVEILDDLMNFVGELVLTRNQLNQNVAVNDHNAIALAAQRLDTVTSELQASIMSTRMQPLGIVLSRFHRIIRDMSNQLGKSVNLELEGEGVELDKTIIENIGDPLTHLVRNAVDHGIELPDARRAQNKDEAGTLSIKARHEAGHVVIEISDDGKGMDPAQIRQKALQLGLIDKARSEEISEKDLLKLVFTPGFSTAEVVSDISGRGVGLDVVYTNIISLGGAIDIYSNPGSGTTFRVSLPLTLAIVPSLLVSANSDSFVIPQINLVELVRISPDQKKSRIEHLGDSVVVRLRDKLLPLVWLDNVLELAGDKTLEDDSTNIAVVKAGDFQYGIVVDQFTDSQEIVVKPLGAHLRHYHAYAGATVLGDGQAAMILDVGGIAQHVHIARHNLEEDAQNMELLNKAQESVGKEKHLLIVENGEDEYFGIELAYVNRIERVRSSMIQHTANKDVIKYRGGTLRVFKLEDAVKSSVMSRDSDVYLVVFHMMGREIAVLVSNIVDIVDTRAEVDEQTFRQPGVVGSAIIMDRITLLLDLFELVKVIDPAMCGDTSDSLHHGAPGGDLDAESKNTVLVVEDSVFFQDKLRIVLEEAGLNVLIAEDGQKGWEALNANSDSIDLVLTDIEMPNISGLELTRLIRGKTSYNNLPVIMLTSLAKETDIAEGMKAGANEYLVKMDQELVKQTINKYLGASKVPGGSNDKGEQHVQH